MNALVRLWLDDIRDPAHHGCIGRRMVFDWIMRKAGIELGQRYPWWGVVLLLILFPSRIPMWVGLPFYDACTDCVKVGNVKLPLHALADAYGKPSPPGYWFRVVGKTEWGTPIIECRVDGYTVDGASNPGGLGTAARKAP